MKKKITIMILSCILVISMNFISIDKKNIDNNQLFKNPLEQVGIEHNKMLKSILSELHGFSKEEQIDYTNLYLSTQLEKKGIDKSYINQKIYHPVNKDYSIFSNGKTLYKAIIENDTLVKSYIDKKKSVANEVNNVLDFLESNNLTLPQIVNEIKRREIIADEIFQEEDLTVMYSFYSTLIHSVNYWAPEYEGGEGGFDNFHNSNSYSNLKINWWKVAGCDGVGALTGALKGGGVWGAVIVGCGSSAISVINQY